MSRKGIMDGRQKSIEVDNHEAVNVAACIRATNHSRW